MKRQVVCSLAAALVAFGILSCSSSSTTTPDASAVDTGVGQTAGDGAAADGAPPAAGEVPADLRDVERDGEGLVITTFGEATGKRNPEWTRATGVLFLLKQVWARSKAANPGLPAAQVKMLDEAVVDLDAGIGAMDQKKAVFAANKVGLAVPELFDYFHSEAPMGVVRMDAVYRQLGIDAHFGDFAGVGMDIASLKSDWMAIKGKVEQRTPTCHRVGGTATVVGDVDMSLAMLDGLLTAKDAQAIEQVSDEGALQIDTLELLFDCPDDGPSKDDGTLGSKCKSNADCKSAELECDLNNAGGKCAPSSKNKIGTSCTSTVDCGSDSRAACQTEAGDGYPGGYCFMEPCDDIKVCPAGSTCVAPGGETPGCFKACATDADCRGTDGYVCQLFRTTPPAGFGPTDHACSFKCTRDDDCHGNKCTVATGKCTP